MTRLFRSVRLGFCVKPGCFPSFREASQRPFVRERRTYKVLEASDARRTERRKKEVEDEMFSSVHAPIETWRRCSRGNGRRELPARSRKGQWAVTIRSFELKVKFLRRPVEGHVGSPPAK